MSKHIAWIDNAKLLAMFLVLFEHHGLENRYVSEWIWTFHLASFFFISGLFANSKSTFSIFIKTNFIRLIVPVFLWHIIGSVSWQPVLFYIMNPTDIIHSLIQNQVDFFMGRSCGFGWFMICLFWIKCEFWMLYRMGSLLLYIAGFCLFPISAYLISTTGIYLPFYMVNSLMAFPFYLVGYLLCDRIKTLQFTTLQSYIIFAILVVFSLYLYHINGTYSLNACEYGHYMAIIYIQGIIGAFGVLLLSYVVQIDGQKVRILREGTIVILLMQPPFLLFSKAIYRLIMKPTHPAPYFNVISALFLSLLIMYFFVPIIKYIDEHIPILNGKYIK